MRPDWQLLRAQMQSSQDQQFSVCMDTLRQSREYEPDRYEMRMPSTDERRAGKVTA